MIAKKFVSVSAFIAATLAHAEGPKVSVEELWEAKNKVVIGEGGYATVYESNGYALKAYHKKDKQDVKTEPQILTKLLTALPTDQIFLNQGLNFIIKHFKTATINEKRVDLLELVDGADFFEFNPQPTSLIFRLFAQIATGTATIHECGCINPDMKPENIMITRDQRLAKLIDLDSLIYLTHPNLNPQPITTDFYCPPEAANIKQNGASPAFNVYQLGLIILAKIAPAFFMEHIFAPIKDIYKFITNCTDGNTELPQTLQFNLLAEDTQKAEEILKNIIKYLSTNKSIEELDLSGLRTLQFELQKLIHKNLINAIDDLRPSGFYKDKFNSEELSFTKKLLKDCIAFKPEDRISAAQASQILQVFSSYLETKERNLEIQAISGLMKLKLSTETGARGENTAEIANSTLFEQEESLEPQAKRAKVIPISIPKCPNYAEVKAMVTKDCPKEMPLTLSKMLFNPDPKSRELAISAIIRLFMADYSYSTTFPWLSLEYFKQKKLNLDLENKKIFREEVYLYGNPRKPGQKWPVPKDLYDSIQSPSLF